jgi:transcriptional regulator with XRE-family HTH domain
MLYNMTEPSASAAYFGAIIDDLINAGMSQGEIAAAVMVAQSEVSRLQNRKRRRVTYETGARIIALHRENTAAKPVESSTALATPFALSIPKTKPTLRTDAEIEALAKELGIAPRVGETYAQLKARCFAKLDDARTYIPRKSLTP